MSNLRDKMDKAGYNREDIFFYERDRELIQKIREENQGKVLPFARKEDSTQVLPQGANAKIRKSA